MKSTLANWFAHTLSSPWNRLRKNAHASIPLEGPSNRVSAHASGGYRPDIDGLRAFAVLAVWAFHLNPHWLEGGFVGVDVFFVVSGYVVTLSLSHLKTESIGSALATFYSRRMKRLIPALLACALGVSLAWSIFIVPFPDESSNAFYRTGISSLVGLGNMYLARSSHNYFDGDTVPNPFTHTWSLGVEEQFYFVFPLLVFACGVGALRARSNQLRLALVLALCVGSFVSCAHWSAQNPTFAYYLMPSRFWELGLGCALALVEQLGYLARFAAHRHVQRYAPAMAMGILAISAKYTSPAHFPYPGAIVPVLATALLVASSRASNSVAVRVLRSPSVVYMGKVSYSLYLWHWPVICLVNRMYGLDSSWVLAATIVVTLLLCVTTHHFIEEPLRHLKITRPRLVFAGAFAAMLVTGASLETVRRTRYSLFAGAEQNWAVDWNPRQDLVFAGTVVKPQDCHLTNGMDAPTGLARECFLSSQDPGRRRLFLVGDSHAYADWPMVQAGLNANLYDLYALSHDGCGVYNNKPEGQVSCGRYWKHVHELLASEVHNGDIVFLATYIRSYFHSETTAKGTDESVRDGLTKLARIVQKNRGTLIIEAPLPVFDQMAVDCLSSWYNRIPANCVKSRDVDLAERAPAMDLLRSFVKQNKNTLLWDPHALLCPDIGCSHFRSNLPLFRDDDHLAPYGGRYLGGHFVEFLRSNGLADSLKTAETHPGLPGR